MAQWLRVLAILPEGLGSFPDPMRWFTTVCNSQFQGVQCPLLASAVIRNTFIHVGKILRHTKKLTIKIKM